MFNYIIFFIIIIFYLPIFGQTEVNNFSVHGMFADETNFDIHNSNLSLTGQVMLLTTEGFISGDTLLSYNNGTIFSIEKNVIIIRKKEKIIADRIVVNKITGELALYNAKVVQDYTLNSTNLINDNVLNITEEEIVFEQMLVKQLKKMEIELKEYREEYVKIENLRRLKRSSININIEEIKIKYARILERYIKTKYQINPFLLKLSLEERKKIETKRQAVKDFLIKYPEISMNTLDTHMNGYIDFRADYIIKKDSNLEIKRVQLSPCRSDNCHILGIKANKAKAELGEYITMYGMSITLFEIPIFYSPWMMFPIKNQRQSGFLKPLLYTNNKEQIIGIPYFQTLGEHADTTLTLSNYKERGNKIDTEIRLSISDTSNVLINTEYIEDKKYLSQTKGHIELNQKIIQEKNIEIDNQINKIKNMQKKYEKDDIENLKKTLTLEEIAKNKANREIEENKAEQELLKLQNEKENLINNDLKETDKRWYWQSSLNLPMSLWASVKVNSEFSSDNSYLSNYVPDSLDIDFGQSLLQPSQNAKRFLLQDGSAEFYGNYFNLSLRLQGRKDLFFSKYSENPIRLPRIEFNLLPFRVFNTPFSISTNFNWERVHRLGGTSWVDSPLINVDAKKIEEKNIIGEKDENEAFVEGERLSNSLKVQLPISLLSILNSNVSYKLDYVMYKSPICNIERYETSQFSNIFSLYSDLPMYSIVSVYSLTENSLIGTIRHDLTPSLQLDYIPDVRKGYNFPIKSQLFYLEDYKTTSQILKISLSSLWTLTSQAFTPQGDVLPRIPSNEDNGVAYEAIFINLLLENGINKPNNKEDYLLLSEKIVKLSDLYSKWSNKELNDYYDKVNAKEFGDNITWPSGNMYLLNDKYKINLLSLTLSTSYDFRYLEKEKELEENKKLKDRNEPLWKTIEPWTNLIVNATSSTNNILPLKFDFNIGAEWGFIERMWSKSTIGLNISYLPLLFSTGFNKSFTYNRTSDPKSTKYEEGFVAVFSPLTWLNFKYAKSNSFFNYEIPSLKTTTIPTRKDPEYEYETWQVINITDIQDCMDIIFSRHKEFDKKEYEAIWALGINIKINNQKKSINQVGELLNKYIHKKINKSSLSNKE